MKIGEIIRKERISREWTQEELAYRCNVSQGLISRLERNAHIREGEYEKYVVRLSEAFEVDESVFATKFAPMTPGETVRFKRRRLGLSQQQLADKAGLSLNQVFDIEHNAYKHKDFSAELAEAFGGILRETP